MPNIPLYAPLVAAVLGLVLFVGCLFWLEYADCHWSPPVTDDDDLANDVEAPVSALQVVGLGGLFVMVATWALYALSLLI